MGKMYRVKRVEDYDLVYNSSFQEKTGYKIPKEQKWLGSGAFGQAYDIGGGKVMKITGDETEANTSASLVGKKIPGIVKYYGVYYFSKRDLYVLIMQKVQPVNDNRNSDFLGEFAAWCRNNIEKDFDYGANRKPKWWISKRAKKAESLRGDPDSAKFLVVVGALVGLKKLGISWDDLHAGNFSFNKAGDPMVFDLGVSKGTSGHIEQFEGFLGPYPCRT